MEDLKRIPISIRWRHFIHSMFLGRRSKLSMKAYWNHVNPSIAFMEDVGKELIAKYSKEESFEGKIGNKVWTLWYQGLDSAPDVVKNCIRLMQEEKGIELVVLDKDNLHEYFTPDVNIQRLVYEKKVSLQNYSDYIRNSLIAIYGGTWMDATIFLTDPDYVLSYADRSFYTVRHKPHQYIGISQGLWSAFYVAGAKGFPLFKFFKEYFEMYYSKYSEPVDYFMVDFLYYIAYKHIPVVREAIDSVEQDNPVSVFSLVRKMDLPYEEQQWDNILKENHLYKLVWKKKFKNEGTIFEAFLNHHLV